MHLEVGLVLPFLFLAAALWASVGHGGATAYLGILTLAGFAAAAVIPSVLVLNVVVAGIAFVAFARAGHLRLRLLLPLVVTSVPMAYLGGRLAATAAWQEWALGVALLAAAVRFLLLPAPPMRPRLPVEGWAFAWAAPALGAVLGFLAGATGIGGGIFLSPVLVLLGWADVRRAGAVAAAFIVLNSLAGLAARLPQQPVDPAFLVATVGVVLLGAVVGASLGARRLRAGVLGVLLGLVLLAAAARSFLTASGLLA